MLFSLVGCIVGFVAAGLLVGTTGPAGWLVIGGCSAAGATPLVRWIRERRRAEQQLELFDIEASLRPLLLRAAGAVSRIEQAAATAPSGPVADLLGENHRSALEHLKQTERVARVGGTPRSSDVLEVCNQLDELAATSEQLVRTTLEARPTQLTKLTARTALVNEALANDSLSNDSPPGDSLSEESNESDHGATNGH